MEDIDLPRPRGDAAGKLAGEDLSPYSKHELDERVAMLRAEIDRVEAHRDKAVAHRSAADALFGKSSVGPAS
jgi:uncharacterized small protein (DUF1192 family)